MVSSGFIPAVASSKQQQGGIICYGNSCLQSLLFPMRKHAGHSMTINIERDRSQNRFCLGTDVVHTVGVRKGLCSFFCMRQYVCSHALLHRETAKYVLDLKRPTDPFLNDFVRLKIGDVVSSKKYSAFGDLVAARNQIEQRCLACPVWTDDGADFIRLKREIDYRDGRNPSKRFSRSCTSRNFIVPAPPLYQVLDESPDAAREENDN